MAASPLVKVDLPRKPVELPDLFCGEKSVCLDRLRLTTAESTHNLVLATYLFDLIGFVLARAATRDGTVQVELPYCERHRKWGTFQKRYLKLAAAFLMLAAAVWVIGAWLQLPDALFIVVLGSFCLAAVFLVVSLLGSNTVTLDRIHADRLVLHGVARPFAHALNADQANAITEHLSNLGERPLLPWELPRNAP